MSKPMKAGPTLAVDRKPADEMEAAALARTVLRPTVNAASAVLCFQNVAPGGELELSALVDELEDQCKQVSDGNLVTAEGMLMAQAHTLDAIFNNLMRRAKGHMGQNPLAVERYMKFGLRAQSQCRATLETLAYIKNPPMVIARQANIAHGPQQVNNGPSSRAGEIESTPNKLLEQTHGEGLDPGTTGQTIRADSRLEALGAKHGTQDDRG